jgi:hypothetical protein
LKTHSHIANNLRCESPKKSPLQKLNSGSRAKPVRRRLDHELPRVLAYGHQNNQVVFVLKGKSLSVWDLKRDTHLDEKPYSLFENPPGEGTGPATDGRFRCFL